MGRRSYRDLLPGEARTLADDSLDELVLQLKALAEVTIDLWESARTDEHLKAAERAVAEEDQQRLQAQIEALTELGIPTIDAGRLAAINRELHAGDRNEAR